VDLDGDGCIEEAECAYIDGLAEHLPDMDIDGDGCVTHAECEESPFSYLLPDFSVTAPVCDYGFYAPGGASQCLQCPDGATRRRRSTSCTECPAGRVDLGDYDDCAAGVYLMERFSVGDEVMCVNQDVDEGGVLLTTGVEVVVATRNPGHYQSLTIVGVFAGTNGTVCFNTSGPAVLNFTVYDPVIAACTGTSGSEFSDSYPCGCGTAVCQDGERCDLGGDNTGHGTGGDCHPTAVLPTPAPTVSATGDPHLVNLQGEHFDVNHAGEFTLLRIPQDASTPAEMELKAIILPERGKPCTTYITEVELSGAWLGGKVVQVRSYRAKAEGEAGRALGLRVMSRGADEEVPWDKLADWTDMTLLLSEYQAKTGLMVTLAKTQWHSKKNAKKGASSVAGQVEVRFQRRRFNESAKVIMRQDLPLQEHLNLAVRQIGALGRVDVGGLLGFDPHPASLESVSPECQRHRDGLDDRRGTRFRPGWKTRWEKIREQRGQAHGDDNEAAANLNDNEAAASLADRDLMCVCPSEDALSEGLAGGEDTEGVLADFQTARLAEATWD
jgi:hypothetical protein